MEQDLFGWLNSQKDSQNTGLLVAPLTLEQQEDISPEKTEKVEEIPASKNEDSTSSSPDEELSSIPDPAQEEIPTYPPEIEQASAESSSETTDCPQQNDYHGEITLYVTDEQPAEIVQNIPEHEQDIPEYEQNISEHEQDIPEYEQDDNPPPDSYIPEEYMPSAETQEEIPANIPDSEDEDSDFDPQDHDWQERATGFTLSLDEPPPELWTHINDDDPDHDYEPTDSLQGAAYVQIHGRNFTERLHHTLKNRKERAEERANSEHKSDPLSPLRQMAIILAGTLIMALGFALLALWFVGRETPDGMKRRAEKFTEAGKIDEAAEIYRRAHRRYPNDAEILAGLSEASQKLGHVQTAKTAHDEYIRLTSPDIPAKKEQPKPATKTEARVKHETVSHLLKDKPLTFAECLNEANHAYNIGMYTRALEYFSRAMKLNSRDYRPYIGLSASYRMKGWYVDSMHILEEMRRKFGRSPALDMEEYFLREAK